MSVKDLAGEIKRLEKQMNSEAKNLEFEKAAATRDRLTKVKEMALERAPGMLFRVVLILSRIVGYMVKLSGMVGYYPPDC